MNDIQLYSWDKAEELVYPLRLEVFVKEQGVPIDLELDEYDSQAQHAVFYHDGFPVGTGRVFKKNFEENTFYIGRLCVLKKYREMGYGEQIMNSLIQFAKSHQAKECCLHAQTVSQYFYQKFGFKASGDTFMEAGIEHVVMNLTMA